MKIRLLYSCQDLDRSLILSHCTEMSEGFRESGSTANDKFRMFCYLFI